MDMSGEFRIAASRDHVWAALNDPEVLKKSIPGCESITKLSDTEMDATATVSLGPVKAKFKGRVKLTDLNPPESYTLTGEGAGGAAGFAKGEARVNLYVWALDRRHDYLYMGVEGIAASNIVSLQVKVVDF